MIDLNFITSNYLVNFTSTDDIRIIIMLLCSPQHTDLSCTGHKMQHAKCSPSHNKLHRRNESYKNSIHGILTVWNSHNAHPLDFALLCFILLDGENWMHFTQRKRKSISCSNRFGMSKISLRGPLKSRIAFDKLVCFWWWWSFFDILEILSRATNSTLICIGVCASSGHVSISFCCLVKKNRRFSVVTVCIPMSSQRCDRIVYAIHFIGINLILFLVGRMNLSIFQGAWKQIIHELSCFSDFFFLAAVAGWFFFSFTGEARFQFQ